MALHIGLDIGGTKFMAAAADAGGALLRRTEPRPTPRPLNEGLALLHAMVEELAAGGRIAGMGAAVGGPLDWKSGVVSPLHQPEWRDVPLKRIMEERWGCPFHVDVDTNAAALGEYLADPGRPPRFFYLTVSTGVGGGFLVDGRIFRGAGGAHPEAGHQAVPFRRALPKAAACECGAPDCLEALVSGNGIRRVYGKPAESLDEREWAEVTCHLAQGLRNVAVLYAPDVIVLGGGVALGRGARIVEDIRAFFKEHLRMVPAPAVRLSSLGHDTALRGALALAKGGGA